jgi:hypothetical protein
LHRYWIVGTRYRPECLNLPCGDPGACKFWGNTYASYSSPDLVNWHLENPNLLAAAAGLPDPNKTAYFVPQMTWCAATKLYILVFELPPIFYTAVATTPAGPFVNATVLMVNNGWSSQIGVFVDPATNDGYVRFNNGSGASGGGNWVVPLSDDYRTAYLSRGVDASGGQGFLEGGGMFERAGRYYYSAGTGCCFCALGGDSRTFVADRPLGPYRFVSNANKVSVGKTFASSVKQKLNLSLATVIAL